MIRRLIRLAIVAVALQAGTSAAPFAVRGPLDGRPDAVTASYEQLHDLRAVTHLFAYRAAHLVGAISAVEVADVT